MVSRVDCVGLLFWPIVNDLNICSSGISVVDQTEGSQREMACTHLTASSGLPVITRLESLHLRQVHLAEGGFQDASLPLLLSIVYIFLILPCI